MSRWKDILAFAEEIAAYAGVIQMRGFRSESTRISYKSRTDLVTNIDRESEEFLYGKILEEYSGHTIVAEEGSRHDTDGDLVWYVDPLDATNNFAHGIPVFCVSLGVYSRQENRVVVGVVYDPLHKEMFTASRGDGAFCNGSPIRVSATGDLGVALLATGFPYDRKDPEKNNLREFTRMSPQVQGIRRLGSAAVDLCYTACGRFDGYWEPCLRPWDMAAGSLIVEEAGGWVSRYDGETFDPEYPQIVASNGLLHESILAVLRK